MYFVIDPSFQEVNRRFVLSFTNGNDRTGIYFIPTMEIKVYNVMIDGRKIFYQSLKNKILENMLLVKIRIIELIVSQIMHISDNFISSSQRSKWTTSTWHWSESNKQLISLENWDQGRNTLIFFILKEVKNTDSAGHHESVISVLYSNIYFFNKYYCKMT